MLFTQSPEGFYAFSATMHITMQRKYITFQFRSRISVAFELAREFKQIWTATVENKMTTSVQMKSRIMNIS